jgi:transcriptional regulator
MNIKKQKRINEAMNLCSDSFRRDKNSIRINTHNTIEHELAKAKLAYFLIQSGKIVFTEVVFKNGARADIFVPEDFVVYEILHSETSEMLKEKLLSYPFEVTVFDFSSTDILKKEFRL